MTRTWMRPGMVVRRMTDEQIIAVGCEERKPARSGLPEERGVVCWVQGARNSLSHDGVMAPVVGEVRIRLGAGHHLFTTYTDEWERVPEEKWTSEERVWSANATFQAPDWYTDGDRVSDPDTYEWWLVRALLPRRHVAIIFPEDGDWPCSWFELAEAAARCRDFDREAGKVSFTWYQHDPVFHALTHLLWRWGFTARLDPYRAATLVESLEAQGITLSTTTEGSARPC